jgi:hypothetical protein
MPERGKPMKKTANQRADAALPTFLDEEPAVAVPADEAVAEWPEATAGEADEPVTSGELAAELESDDDGVEPRDQTPGDTGHDEPPPAATPATGMAGTVTGLLLAAGGAALGWFAPAELQATLGRVGLGAGSLVVVGAVVAAASRVIGSVRHAAAARAEALSASLRADVRYLVAAQRSHDEKAPAAGEELQHLLMLLQRQDEKINNLSKAIKMYGKPLMEIAGSSTEVATTLSQVRAAVDAGKQERQQIGATIAKLAGSPATVDFAPLQERLGRLEVAVQAIAQRIDDPETRRSLLRLEDAAKATQAELQRIGKGDQVKAVASQLQEALDGTTGKLMTGISQLRDGNLGGLETSVREIQREVAGVATAVAQIQNAVRSGAAPARSATPAPGANAAPAATAAPAAPATPAPAAAAPTSPAPAGGEAGGYQTGARSTSGKNVLGAIQKLKQMKT